MTIMYDLIIPLGENCSCAENLKDSGLRKFSLPFDWSGLELGEKDSSGGFCAKCELIAKKCENLLEFEDFKELEEKSKNHNCRYIINTCTGLKYIHEFKKTDTFERQFLHFKQKYERRVDRLYKEIEKHIRFYLFIIVL